jgi:hypothetical protein
MADILHRYPQSSCPCWECDKKKYHLDKGPPSNLSIPYCLTPDIYDCYNEYIFKENNTPGFGLVETCVSSCPKYSYLSADPRLSVPVRGIRVPIDKPPLDSTILLKDIYNDDLKNYGQNYNTYSDINAGQIMYYTTKSLEDAYNEPVFNGLANTVGVLYKDPMDNIKPHYERFPVGKQNNPMTESRCDMDLDGYGLSWLKDSSNQRQDLISKQMSTINQQRWAPRWNNR